MKRILSRLVISLASLILTLIFLEICARVYKSEYEFVNFWELTRDLFGSGYPTEFHERLGWVPKQGFAGKENMWGTEVTISQDGIRANGQNALKNSKSSENLILAIGDSFTFGDQVSDHETWPAILEKLTGIRTLNGGVFGYGVDQTYLRMRSLAKKYQPTVIVFSLIPSDIYRCELSERTSVAKPYFQIKENSLILRNEHIRKKSKSHNKDILRHILGNSFLIHKLMLHAFPEYWLQGSWLNKKANNDGEGITCRIFKKIEDFLEETPSIKKFYLLVQYRSQQSQDDLLVIDRVLSCIEKDKINVVDLRYLFSDLERDNYKKYSGLFDGHMTAGGNHFVAQVLSKMLLEE